MPEGSCTAFIAGAFAELVLLPCSCLGYAKPKSATPKPASTQTGQRPNRKAVTE